MAKDDPGKRLGFDVFEGRTLYFGKVANLFLRKANIVEIVFRQFADAVRNFLVGEAIFIGLEASIRCMRELMDEARK